MLLICPVRPGDANDELKIALRTWERNLLYPEGLVLMTVGYKPSWLDPDIHVEGNLHASMPLAVFSNVKMGAEKALNLGAHDVLYMNDDFFCLDPMESVLPVRRNSTLAQQIAQFPENASSWWPTSLRLTASWLSGQGFPHPDSYEVHRPLPASAEGMFTALSRWEWGSGPTVPQWRTVYGTLNKVEATPVRDVKLNTRNTAFGSPWVSTSDQSWRRYGIEIRRGFQKPSRWER